MATIGKPKVKRIFGLKDLLKTLGVSRSWLYSEMSAGRFPRPRAVLPGGGAKIPTERVIISSVSGSAGRTLLILSPR